MQVSAGEQLMKIFRKVLKGLLRISLLIIAVVFLAWIEIRASRAYYQRVFDALTKVAITPSHSHTTSTAVNGGKLTEGETIFANGQKYIRARGKWMRIPVTSQDVLEQEKEKQQHGNATCQFLRS